ncbi:signal peptidase I [Streptococcus castoreus]|uniref:signal peptidase I n=1 Tax=Streptococcus castoreus TaxID=254786 RepID=UPI000410C61B|nr:signal peptidase I [Streptococcus castoreus]
MSIKNGANASQTNTRYQLIRQLCLKMAIIGIIVYGLGHFVLGIRMIKNSDMFPMLKPADFIFYYRLEKQVKVNDVVIYDHDKQEKVGRIIAQAGDTVDINSEGTLLINGHIHKDALELPTLAHSSGPTYPYKVPNNSYFILYDNRTIQEDSRYIGAVSKNSIKGVVTTLVRVRDL